MTTTIATLTNKWTANWKKQQLTKRLVSLSGSFLFSFIFTMVVLGSAGVVATALLPPGLATAAIEFLAVVYLLLLGLYLVVIFDLERVQHFFKQLLDAVEYSSNNITTENVNQLSMIVQELMERMGKA
jgi:hypothetical protein